MYTCHLKETEQINKWIVVNSKDSLKLIKKTWCSIHIIKKKLKLFILFETQANEYQSYKLFQLP